MKHSVYASVLFLRLLTGLSNSVCLAYKCQEIRVHFHFQKYLCISYKGARPSKHLHVPNSTNQVPTYQKHNLP